MFAQEYIVADHNIEFESSSLYTTIWDDGGDRDSQFQCIISKRIVRVLLMSNG